jgi:hypothetical protein
MVTVAVNFEAWRRPGSADVRANAIAAYAIIRRNTLVAAIAYLWGALAMQGIYLRPLTGLHWQHAWQYAAVMVLLAALCLGFVRSMRTALAARRRDEWHLRAALPLTLAQGAIAAGGLAALAVSGKLTAVRADWAANRVFAGLAIAILAIAMASVLSLRRASPR